MPAPPDSAPLPTLGAVQRAFGGALLDWREPASLPALSDALGVDAALLGIYRNTSLRTLITALSLSYPAVRALVGADFFEAAAHEFIAAHAPERACLNDYGRELPDFLASFAPASTVCYLADVARLEWAVNRALHAPDAPSLDVQALSRLGARDMPRVCFVAHPAVTVLRLAAPADAIWRAVLAEDDAAMAALDVTDGPVWLLVERSAMGVQVQRLYAASGVFTERLCAGEPLQAALEAMSADTASAELAADAVLAEHLAAGRFSQWRIQAEASS